MHLTTDQLKAIESGEAVSVTIDDTMCVVIRQDVYELSQRLTYDDSELSDNEREAITALTLDDLDGSPLTREEIDLLADEAAEIAAQGETVPHFKES